MWLRIFKSERTRRILRAQVRSRWLSLESLERRELLVAGAVSIAAGSLQEPDTGSALMTFTLTRSGDLTKVLQIGYSTANGTATAGADYSTVTSGIATFATGFSTTTASAPVLGDAFVEGNETLSINLSGSVDAAGNTLLFTGKQDTTVGSEPLNTASGDINGDGKPDLVVANSSSASISVLLSTINISGGSQTASFTRTDFTVGSVPAAIAVGDFNGDGKPDLAVTNSMSNTVSVFINTTAVNGATPTFAARVDLATGLAPNGIAMADFNGDGLNDIVVDNTDANTISVFRNQTTTNSTLASFAAKQDFAAPTTPSGLAIGDINQDGGTDIIVASLGSNCVSVLLNTTPVTTPASTTFTFAARQDFAGPNSMDDVAVGDLNGDGTLDIAAVSYAVNTVSTWMNVTLPDATSANFAARQDAAAGTGPVSIALGNFSGSGKLDLAIADTDGNNLLVLPNTTPTNGIAAVFSAARSYTTGSGPYSTTVADWDGDSRPDLAVANSFGGSVSVLLNGAVTVSAGTATGTIIDNDFSVTNTSDALTPGSLRQAITLANASGLTSVGISLDLPGTQSILPGSLLPALNKPANFYVAAGNTITIGSAGSSSFPDVAGTAGKIGAGVLVITGNQVHSASSVLNVTEGKLELQSDGGANLSIVDNAQLQIDVAQNLAGLTINTGGTTQLLSGGGFTVNLANLALNGSGKLDVTNERVVVASTAGAQNALLTSLSAKIATALAAGTWTGPGITSSLAASDASHLTGVGIRLNTGSPGALLRRTYYGDANLDGVVNGSDYALTDNGYNFFLSGWNNGDFNYDGHISGADYALIDNSFNFQAAPLADASLQPLSLNLNEAAVTAIFAQIGTTRDKDRR